jgi:hypothetical protein
MDEENKKIERPNWICDPCGQLYGRWYQGNYSGPLKALRYIPRTEHVISAQIKHQ